ncbi:hypothetical protein HDU96_000251, partial [Phlyctochytrium bullatum]
MGKRGAGRNAIHKTTIVDSKIRLCCPTCPKTFSNHGSLLDHTRTYCAGRRRTQIDDGQGGSLGTEEQESNSEESDHRSTQADEAREASDDENMEELSDSQLKTMLENPLKRKKMRYRHAVTFGTE